MFLFACERTRTSHPRLKLLLTPGFPWNLAFTWAGVWISGCCCLHNKPWIGMSWHVQRQSSNVVGSAQRGSEHSNWQLVASSFWHFAGFFSCLLVRQIAAPHAAHTLFHSDTRYTSQDVLEPCENGLVDTVFICKTWHSLIYISSSVGILKFYLHFCRNRVIDMPVLVLPNLLT